MSALPCFCSSPDAATASHIAQTPVSERLAACVNGLPGMRSIHRREGAVESADAVLLAKIQAGREPAPHERIAALHPDELPEGIAVEVAGGLPGYLAWIAQETRPDAAEPSDASPSAGRPAR